MRDGELYLGGRWQPARSDERLVVRSPHDGSVVGETSAATVDEVDEAVRLASAAFERGDWSRRPVAERIEVIAGLAERYATRQEELARTISQENGSPITFSQLGQVGAIPFLLEGFVAAARALDWETGIPGMMGATRVWREPVGVVGAITAWNVPQILIVAKLVPALLAGCSVVVKPAPESPLDAVILAELVDELGLPEGVVSILPGGVEAGRHLVAHPLVDKVAFTGSTAVGREIAGVCGPQLKRMSLELGGKSAAIVLEDADVERTAGGLRFASFMNNGQACAAQTRVLAPRARYADVVDALAAQVASFVVGDPLDPATDIGPLVNERQQRRVLDYIVLGAGRRRPRGGRRGSGARRRHLRGPHAVRRRGQRHAHRPGGDLRAGGRGHPLRRRGRRRPHRQRLRPTGWAARCGPRTRPVASSWPAGSAPACSASTPSAPMWPPPSGATRPAASAASTGPPASRRSWRPRPSTAPDRAGWRGAAAQSGRTDGGDHEG